MRSNMFRLYLCAILIRVILNQCAQCRAMIAGCCSVCMTMSHGPGRREYRYSSCGRQSRARPASASRNISSADGWVFEGSLPAPPPPCAESLWRTEVDLHDTADDSLEPRLQVAATSPEARVERSKQKEPVLSMRSCARSR